MLFNRSAQYAAQQAKAVPVFPDNRNPAVGEPVTVDGFEGIITSVGLNADNPSPIYGDTKLAVNVRGLTGEWVFWIYVTDLVPQGRGWRRDTV